MHFRLTLGMMRKRIIVSDWVMFKLEFGANELMRQDTYFEDGSSILTSTMETEDFIVFEFRNYCFHLSVVTINRYIIRAGNTRRLLQFRLA